MELQSFTNGLVSFGSAHISGEPEVPGQFIHHKLMYKLEYSLPDETISRALKMVRQSGVLMRLLNFLASRPLLLGKELPHSQLIYILSDYFDAATASFASL